MDSGQMNPATPVQPTASHNEPFPGHQMRRRGTQLRYLVLVTAFVLYLILGAGIFSTIEAPAMEEIANNVGQLRGKFLERHPNVKGEYIVGGGGGELKTQ